MEKRCTISGCVAPEKWISRGFCPTHYSRWRKHGDPNKIHKNWGVNGPHIKDWSGIPQPNGCHLWPHGSNKIGYGRVRFKGKSHNVHRLVLERKLGRPLRYKKEACHTCDVRLCVNEEHLYEGSYSDNLNDAYARTRVSS